MPDSTVWRYVVRDELLPGNDGAEEHEHGAVENQVDNGWKWQLFCLLGEPAVVGESYTRAESDQEVIASERRANAYTEYGKQKIEDDERGSRDITSLVREAEESVGTVSNYETDCNAKDALPENGDEDPFFDCRACA